MLVILYLFKEVCVLLHGLPSQFFETFGSPHQAAA